MTDCTAMNCYNWSATNDRLYCHELLQLERYDDRLYCHELLQLEHYNRLYCYELLQLKKYTYIPNSRALAVRCLDLVTHCKDRKSLGDLPQHVMH
jgi:hypothetical protein